MLLLSKINLISKKRGHKKYAFGAYAPSRFKIIFKLPTKVITLYVQVTIIKIGVFGLGRSIARRKICFNFAMLLALDK